MSGIRRKSRELALQVLFQSEFAEDANYVEQLRYFQDSFAIADEVSEYATRLLSGIEEHSQGIDDKISSLSPNWTLARMAKVDLSVLRIAVFEIIHVTDVPAKVAINEAIELAKKYGNTESAGFINGILDSVMKEQ